MEWHTEKTAHAAYIAQDFARAMAMANTVVVRNPHSADAHLCVALASLRMGKASDGIAALRRCAMLRSGDWIVERLRADLLRMPPLGLHKNDTLALGAFVRSKLSTLSPALPQDRRRADGAYINVVGTSLVRSFGGNDAFFPLFIGMGPSTLTLTEELFVGTRRKFLANLARLDTRKDTVVVLGSDPYYHVNNFHKTRPQAGRVTDDDLRYMDATAERHKILLTDVKKAVTGKVLLLAVTPAYDLEMNEMGLYLNSKLADICKELNVFLIDLWDTMIDPETRMMRNELSAHAYQNDIHYSLEAIPLFIDRLKELGVLDGGVLAGRNFDWTHVFDCEIDKGEKTRIWCEPSVSPNNAFKSHKIAASYVGGRVADLVSALLLGNAIETIGVINARDCFLPISLPPQLFSAGVALSEDAANCRMGQRVLDLYGRCDFDLFDAHDPRVRGRAGWNVGITVVCLYPPTWREDWERAKPFLTPGSNGLLVIMAPSEAELHGLVEGATVVSIGVRQLPEEWRGYVAGLVMPGRLLLKA